MQIKLDRTGEYEGPVNWINLFKLGILFPEFYCIMQTWILVLQYYLGGFANAT